MTDDDLTDLERTAVLAWIGEGHPAANVLGQVGRRLYPDSLAEHPRLRAMIAAIEARVRAELANEADRRADGYVGDGAVWVARDVLREFAEDIRANRLSVAAGSSPDTTPEGT